ncbi:MAG: lipid A biosynthesis acyltransferase [Burkholderiales bacterium]
MKHLGSRLVLGLAWLLHFLPLPVLAWLGKGLGRLLFWAGKSRRLVALKNLSLCFPALSQTRRQQIARAHFQAFAQVMLEQGLFWWASDRRFLRTVTLTGGENWIAVQGRPVILLAPHFVGLDWAGVRLSELKVLASIYSRPKNKLLDRMLLKGRTRFNQSVLFSRQDGLRGVVKALRQGIPFYYLPDLDFGRRNAVFVPFFGVPAATVTGLSRLAKIAHAVVLPVVARQLAQGRGYEVTIYPAWDNFPTDDVTADTRRMNEFIEQRIGEMPEQYLWTHKRFKTRPPDEPRLYD